MDCRFVLRAVHMYVRRLTRTTSSVWARGGGGYPGYRWRYFNHPAPGVVFRLNVSALTARPRPFLRPLNAPPNPPSHTHTYPSPLTRIRRPIDSVSAIPFLSARRPFARVRDTHSSVVAPTPPDGRVQGLLARLREVEAQINAAVATEDAERMADGYAAAARARSGPRERGSGADQTEIARIVEVPTICTYTYIRAIRSRELDTLCVTVHQQAYTRLRWSLSNKPCCVFSLSFSIVFFLSQEDGCILSCFVTRACLLSPPRVLPLLVVGLRGERRRAPTHWGNLAVLYAGVTWLLFCIWSRAAVGGRPRTTLRRRLDFFLYV